MKIIVDITTTYHQPQFKSGICRTERILAWQLKHEFEQVTFISWRDKTLDFVEVNPTFDELGRIVNTQQVEDQSDIFTRLESKELFVAGSAWMNNSRYATALSLEAKSNRLNINLLIYDLIPWKFPESLQPGYAKVWIQNFSVLVRAARRLLVYSDAVKNDLEKFLSKIGHIKTSSIYRIFLGNSQINVFPPEQDEQEKHEKKVNHEYHELIQSNIPFCLAVGGIHPRKNYFILYQAWKKLYKLCSTRMPLLVIVGGVKWNSAHLHQLFKNDNEIGRYYVNLDKIDDQQLGQLYSKALCSLYPSLVEGWGLPVEESLLNGTACIASDIPSIREINSLHSNIITIVNPVDPDAWANAILKFLDEQYYQYVKSTIIAFRKPRSWSETATQIKQAIVDHVDESLPKEIEIKDESKQFSAFELVSSIKVISDGWSRVVNDHELYVNGTVLFDFSLLNRLNKSGYLIVSLKPISVEQKVPPQIKVFLKSGKVNSHEITTKLNIPLPVNEEIEAISFKILTGSNSVVMSLSFQIHGELKNYDYTDKAIEYISQNVYESGNNPGLRNLMLAVSESGSGNLNSNVYYLPVQTKVVLKDKSSIKGIALSGLRNVIVIESTAAREKKYRLNLVSNLDFAPIGHRPIVSNLIINGSNGETRNLVFGSKKSRLENKAVEFLCDDNDLLLDINCIFNVSPDWLIMSEIFKIHRASLLLLADPSHVVQNKVIRKVLPGSGQILLAEGWGHLENGFVWSNQLKAKFRVYKGRRNKSKLFLLLSVMNRNGTPVTKSITISYQKQQKEVEFISVRKVVWLTLDWQTTELEWEDIVFEVTELNSPLNLGINNDSRELGVRVYKAILI